VECGDPGAVRFEFAESLRAITLEGDVVRDGSSLELVESAELVLVHGDDH
jgi:hypothetical protein